MKTRHILLALATSTVFLATCDSPALVEPEDDESEPATGDLVVLVEQSGRGVDPDSVTITFTHLSTSKTTSLGLAHPDSARLRLPLGRYAYTISDVDSRCEDPDASETTVGEGTATLQVPIDCIGAFAYQRWFSASSAHVWWVDERGSDQPLATGGWRTPRSFSPDASSVLVRAIEAGQCANEIISLDGTRSPMTPMFGASIIETEWSPDGTMLVAAESNACSGAIAWSQVVFYDGVGTPLFAIPSDGGDHHGDPTWSPDGATVAFTRHGNITLFDVAKQSISSAYSTPVSPGGLKWSPDGTKILYTVRPQRLAVLDVATGDVTMGPSDQQSLRPVWHPDSRRIVYSAGVGGGVALWIFDGDSQEARPLLIDPPEDALAGTVPDDVHVFFSAKHAAGYGLFVGNIDTGEYRLVHGSAGAVYQSPRLSYGLGPPG